MMDNAGD